MYEYHLQFESFPESSSLKSKEDRYSRLAGKRLAFPTAPEQGSTLVIGEDIFEITEITWKIPELDPDGVDGLEAFEKHRLFVVPETITLKPEE